MYDFAIQPMEAIYSLTTMINKKPVPSLVFCVLMDIIGMTTYAIPLIGEWADMIWAPISSLIFWSMFGGWKGLLGAGFNFLEEFLPGTDIIPSFTLAWLIRKVFSATQSRALTR
ncbi:hypothetical protein [Parasegetibacter sp. NRK P23]|uniref:hypothetical protein n=1 Tax=Parasegetibacter sp. NRK P23 TaxID=2942999 RepID=UPI002042F9C6|nr:hypothetical protein [Parasegetibacter sp. NRK P23]